MRLCISTSWPSAMSAWGRRSWPGGFGPGPGGASGDLPCDPPQAREILSRCAASSGSGWTIKGYLQEPEYGKKRFTAA